MHTTENSRKQCLVKSHFYKHWLASSAYSGNRQSQSCTGTKGDCPVQMIHDYSSHFTVRPPASSTKEV